MIKRIIPFLAVLVLFCAACSNSSSGDGGDTGSDSASPMETELAVIAEMNFARTRPAEYVTQRLVPQQTNPTILRSNTNEIEFRACLQECINEMIALDSSPRGSLSSGIGLYRAARDWVQVQGKGTHSTDTGHDPNLYQRIQKYCTYTRAGENIAYGYSTPEEIVMALLIDDGVADRGHRKNILETDGHGPYTHAGVSIGSHGYYTVMCCIDYASGYAEK